MRKKVYFKTFGCRTNLFDSQVMMSSLEAYDITQNESEADIIIVNSCTVTNSADSGVRGYINQVNRDGSKKIYLTGCGAHTKGESLFKANKVDGVFGQGEKEKIDALLNQKTRFFELGDLNHIDKTIVSEFVGKSRAFIKIQEGCDFRCSYCIIPFVRGDARSMDESKILQQVSTLASNGFGEFILTGTNVGSYGKGERRSIASLLKKMSQLRGVRRIRLGSLEPVQITDEFMELLDEPWLEKHLHIALQHTAPKMLKIMNRRNKFSSDMELFHTIASRGYALGTDFIVGHPGESEALFDEGYANLAKLPLTHIHAFSFSKRDNTPAATMKEQVNGAIAKERLKKITTLVDQKNYNFRKEQGVLEVLLESRDESGYYSGYDQFFNKIRVKSDRDLEGNWIDISRYEVLTDENYATI